MACPKFKVHVHDERFSLEELLLNPEWFPDIADRAIVLLEFSKDDGGAPAASVSNRLVLRAKHFDGGADGEKPTSTKRMQLSLLKRVAEARGVAPWVNATVTLAKTPEEECAAEFAEFSFKDQFISRADIWRFKTDVVGEPTYVGKTFNLNGMRATARELRGPEGQLVDSAILVERTRFIFRSRSTRIFWLVQMSYEIWEPTGGDDDSLHVERLVDGFAAPLLKRWRELDVNHSLSVVLFTRLEKENSSSKVDHEDLYRVALENEHAARIDEVALVATLKRELVAFAKSLAIRRYAESDNPHGLAVARAADGNVLEAINLTLNVLDKHRHYMDRDLQRTGNSIVLLSAGAGVFTVDRKLAKITKQRMLDNGIGMDMLSLAVPPLHTAPIFMHPPQSSKGSKKRGLYYEVPHWINLSFVDPGRAEAPRAWIAAAAPRRARDGWRMAGLDLDAPRRRRLYDDDDKSTIHDQTSPQQMLALSHDSRYHNFPPAATFGCNRVPAEFAYLVDSFAGSLPDSKPSSSLLQREDQHRKEDEADEMHRASQNVELCIAKQSVEYETGLGGIGRSYDDDDLVHAFDDINCSLSSSAATAWQPSIHIGSLTSRDVREETTTHWYEIGGYDAGSDGSRATQPSPESLPTGKAAVSASSNRHQLGERKRPQAASPVEEGDEAADLEADLPYAYNSFDASPEIRMHSSATHTMFIPTSSKDGYRTHQFRQTLGAARDSMRATARDDSVKSSEPVAFTREKRNSLGSRSPSRHAPPLEEQFDAHDGAVYMNETPLFHEPLQRRATMTAAAPTQNSTPPTNELSISRTHLPLAGQRSVGGGLRDHPASTGRLNELSSITPTARRHHPTHLLSLQEQHQQPVMKRAHSSLHYEVVVGSAKNEGTDGGQQPAGEKVQCRFINPFKREDEEEVLRERSHNRRRWSHVFPQGEEEFRSTHDSVAGPNWKSLSTPAILPLETDYLPADFGTNSYKNNNAYQEGNYTVVALNDKDIRLIDEMVAQRIGGDYQIVMLDEVKQEEDGNRKAPKNEGLATSPGLSAMSIHALSRASKESRASRRDRQLRRRQNHDAAASKKGITEGKQQRVVAGIPRGRSAKETKLQYILSMGHHIQTLTYNAIEQSVGVRLFREPYDNKDLENHFEYTYSLWLSNSDGLSVPSNTRGAFVTKTQTFLKYPAPETKWNMLDNVISGFLTPAETLGHVKFRRMLFAVIPDCSVDHSEYFKRFEKFEEFLNSKRTSSSTLRLSATRSVPGCDSSRAPEDAPTPQQSKQHLQISLENSRWNDQWLALECDSVVDATRCYRFAVNWLLCSGWVVEEFLALLCRKAKQFGIKFVQVPEYSLRSDIHPFIAHALGIRVPTARLQTLVERSLVRQLDCVLDSVSSVDFEGGVRGRMKDRTVPSVGGDTLGGSTEVDSSKQPRKAFITLEQSSASTAERQYLHSSGSVFVRAHSNGVFTWVKNRLRNPYASFKVRPYDGYDEDILRRLRILARTHALIDKILSLAFAASSNKILKNSKDSWDRLLSCPLIAVELVATFYCSPGGSKHSAPMQRHSHLSDSQQPGRLSVPLAHPTPDSRTPLLRPSLTSPSQSASTIFPTLTDEDDGLPN